MSCLKGIIELKERRGKMKIFLDDLRAFPKDGYECVRTYRQCIFLISLFKEKLEVVNLDYDLREEKTGLDILVFMKENRIIPETIIIHSTHTEGCQLMREYVEENFPTTQLLHRSL